MTEPEHTGTALGNVVRMAAETGRVHASTANPATHGAVSAALQLEAQGYAQVIVVLSPQGATDASAATSFTGVAATGVTVKASSKRGRAAASLAGAGFPSAVTSSASRLQRYFVVPPAAQDAALAQSRFQAAARATGPGRSAAAYTGLAAATGRRASLSREAASSLTKETLPEVPKVRIFENLGVMLGTVDANGLAGLQSDPDVKEVQPAPQISLIRPVDAVVKRKSAGATWGLEALGVPALWDAGLSGKGVLIGHLDTGVDGSHPALAGAIKAFAEFDELGQEVVGAPARDSGEHGTHTAGTIAGRQVGATRFGVAPEAQLLSAMVIEGGNTVARILAGMNWVVGQGARVLSMSLGLRGYTPAFLTITRALRARGVLPVIAVGNEGPGTSRSPGNYVEALSVGACDEGLAVADFSGSQSFPRTPQPLVPDLVAPGDGVLSCIPGGRYAEMSGTSMATPHMAGFAALLFNAKPGATIDDVENAILDSCALQPGMLPDRANRGLPNGPRAFERLTGTVLVSDGINTARQAATSKQPKKSGRKRAATTRSGGKKARPRAKKLSEAPARGAARARGGPNIARAATSGGRKHTGRKRVTRRTK